MKKLIFTMLLAIGSAAAFAQCGKTVVLKSSETTHLTADGSIDRTDQENTEITISPTEMSFVAGDQPRQTATVKDMVCNWTVPFKEGKTTFKVSFNDDNGNERTAAITIEGKAGKVTLTFVPDFRPEKIQVVLDSFVEKS